MLVFGLRSADNRQVAWRVWLWELSIENCPKHSFHSGSPTPLPPAFQLPEFRATVVITGFRYL